MATIQKKAQQLDEAMHGIYTTAKSEKASACSIGEEIKYLNKNMIEHSICIQIVSGVNAKAFYYAWIKFNSYFTFGLHVFFYTHHQCIQSRVHKLS